MPIVFLDPLEHPSLIWCNDSHITLANPESHLPLPKISVQQIFEFLHYDKELHATKKEKDNRTSDWSKHEMSAPFGYDKFTTCFNITSTPNMPCFATGHPATSIEVDGNIIT
ncbi:hypothetical protein BDQ17DRAFT_1332860 [Cyathus striatus]|nr:hypothetical protein BDQ17DRAFT_1332860 [Cyathus striatus]